MSMTDTTERGETLDALIERCVAAGWQFHIYGGEQEWSDNVGYRIHPYLATLYDPARGPHSGKGDTPLAALTAAIEAAAAAGHTIGEGTG